MTVCFAFMTSWLLFICIVQSTKICDKIKTVVNAINTKQVNINYDKGIEGLIIKSMALNNMYSIHSSLQCCFQTRSSRRGSSNCSFTKMMTAMLIYRV